MSKNIIKKKKNITKKTLLKYLCRDSTNIIINYIKGSNFWESLKLGYVEVVVNRLIKYPLDACSIEIAAKNAKQDAIVKEAQKYKRGKYCEVCLSYYNFKS